MSNKPISRREFLKKTASAAAAGTLLPALPLLAAEEKPAEFPYDAKGLPTKALGKTGVRLPRIGIGGGSRWVYSDAMQKPEQWQAFLKHALDNGLYYWDTAAQYKGKPKVSEERYGDLLKDHRKKVFLQTKLFRRGLDDIKEDFETSLKRLQVDSVDSVLIHAVRSTSEVKKFDQNGIYKLVKSFKDQKMTRFIGFSGHSSASAMKAMLENFDFDVMLSALTHYKNGRNDFEKTALPIAKKKGVGVLVMKCIQPRQSIPNLPAEKLIRYALSLDETTAAVIGMENLDQLKENIALLKKYKPMSKEEIQKMKITLAPFFEDNRLPWRNRHYIDGDRHIG